MFKIAMIGLGRGVLLFGVNLIFGMAMFAVSAIENNVARCVLSFVLLACGYAVSFIVCRFAGRADYRTKLVGDIKRKKGDSELSASGSYHPSKEYRAYKGFLIGVCACIVPALFILLAQLTHSDGLRLTLFLIGGWSVLPLVNINSSVNLFYGLFLCAALCVVTGIAYISGSRKEKFLQFVLSKRAG